MLPSHEYGTQASVLLVPSHDELTGRYHWLRRRNHATFKKRCFRSHFCAVVVRHPCKQLHSAKLHKELHSSPLRIVG